ncbi:MAG: hypothetical protein K6E96_05365 [Bacteroidales bacterium]|nr:hypothetical protein [Bacteroidales bacterium]
MKKIVLLIAVLTGLVFGTGGVWAQEVTTLMGMSTPQKNLVRQYTATQSIHYVKIGINHYFVLHDLADPDSAIVADFPNEYDVNDFEVYHDTVYFCGTEPNGGNPFGIVGFISVADLFYYNHDYNIGTVKYLFYNNDSTDIHLTSLDRMDLYDENGIVHIAAVGEMALVADYSNLRRTACDLWFNRPLSRWWGTVLHQKDDLYKPSDITCTDNAVVVSAYDDNPNYSILLAFRIGADFPDHPLYPYSIRIGDRRYGDNVLVERLRNNDVAVAHYSLDPGSGEYMTALHRIDNIHIFSIPPSSFSLHYTHGIIPPLTPLRDLRYHRTDDALMLLYDFFYPSLGPSQSAVLNFNAYSLTSLLVMAWYCNHNILATSMDNHIQSPLFSQGGIHFISNAPLLTLLFGPNENCHDHTDLFYRDVTPIVTYSTGAFEDKILKCNVPRLPKANSSSKHPLKDHCTPTKTQDHETKD